MPSREVQQATHALLDPFTEPEPSQETGPGAHFGSTFSKPAAESSKPSPQVSVRSQGSRLSKSTNPFRNRPRTSGADSKASSVIQTSEHGYMTPPPSATTFPSDISSPPAESGSRSPAGKENARTRVRSTSLQERYPGDTSNAPLTILRKESKRAQRSPHLRKKHQQGADSIDKLDLAGLGLYHHEGPYDAASRARNSHQQSSPLAATRRQNEEALRATPRENIQDSVRRHRPLDGVAIIPPGQKDRFGRRYDYEEGKNLMIEDNYRRWPGIEYKDDDIKGKGEPSYSIEKALKQHRMEGTQTEGVELQTHRRNRSDDSVQSTGMASEDRGMQRSTSSRGPGDTMRRRFGSLRKRRP